MKGPLVLQTLAGVKTQTRRVVTPQPLPASHSYQHLTEGWWTFGDNTGRTWRCPYGVPGDRLWCKETFAVETQLGTGAQRVVYRASEREGYLPGWDQKWKPSIFMPRWASRLVLELTEVRVQRLQDISEEDAKAEGAELGSCTYGDRNCRSNSCPKHGRLDRYRHAFHLLWDSINEDRGFGWDANPWVWALTFKRVEGER